MGKSSWERRAGGLGLGLSGEREFTQKVLIGKVSLQEGRKAAWPSTPKDTIRPQSENVLTEDLTGGHILLCATVPEISWRTVKILKGF